MGDQRPDDRREAVAAPATSRPGMAAHLSFEISYGEPLAVTNLCRHRGRVRLSRAMRAEGSVGVSGGEGEFVAHRQVCPGPPSER